MLAIPLIRRKLVPARLPDPFIPRPKLLALLQRGLDPSRRLTLVCGGPGYGKSTLVAAYLRELDVPSAWYALDDSDADLATFLTYLGGLVKAIAPQAADRALELVRSAPNLDAVLQTAIGLLAEDVAEAVEDGAVLVLDDFHLVSRVPGILKATEYLVQYLPDNFQLVLISRETPQLPLPQMRVRQQLVELGVRDLRFGAQELRELLQRLSGVTFSDAEALELLGHTDGWVATVILAAQAVKVGGGEPRDLLLRELGQPSALYDYLAQEVFACQPEAVQAFLLQTSLVALVDAVVAREALGIEDAAGRIHELVQANMIFPAEGEAGAFAYHPSFRRFLQARLEATLPPAELARLCARLGAALAPTQPEEALGLLLRGQDLPGAVRLVTALAEGLIANNQLDRLRAVIGRFDEPARASSWVLGFYLGEVHRLWGEFDQAQGLFQQAERVAPAGEPLGRVLAHQAAICLGRGEARALEVLARAEEEFSPGDLLGRAFAANLRGAWALGSNDSPAALASYEQALACYRQLADPLGQAKVLNNLGMCYTRFGQFEAAIANYREAIAQCHAAGRAAYPMTHNNLAAIYGYQGDFRRALAEAERALELAGLLRSRRDGLYAELALGFAYAGLGDERRAQEHYERARDGALNMQDKATAAKACCGLAELALVMGAPARAQALLDEGLSLTGLPLEDPRQGDLAILLGLVRLENGDLDGAGTLLDRLEAEMGRLKYRYRHVQVLGYQARLAAARGDAARAGERRQEADRLAEAYGYPQLAAPEASAPPAVAEPRGVEPAITIRCFGELAVSVGDRPIPAKDWRGFKTKLILAYLLGHPDGVTKEQLTDLLYGEMDTTRTAILVLISRLRHALEPGLDKQTPSRFVQFVDGRYRFNVALPFQLDTQEFEYRCRLGSDAALAVEARRAHWRQALALYQGPYLAELTAEGPWIAIERERFHRMAQDVHTAMVRSYLEAGDDAGALEAAEANLAFDSCCELAHQVKMGCLARMGQREGALRHYTIMKQVFERELGGPPSGTTQALYQSIARGQDAPLPEALR